MDNPIFDNSAYKNRWKGSTPEQRKAFAISGAKAKNASMTPEERKAHSLMMFQNRRLKKKK